MKKFIVVNGTMGVCKTVKIDTIALTAAETAQLMAQQVRGEKNSYT